MVLSLFIQKNKIFQQNPGSSVHKTTTRVIGAQMIINASVLFYDLFTNLKNRHFQPEKWQLALFMLLCGIIYYNFNHCKSQIFKYMPFLSTNSGKFFFYQFVSSLLFNDSKTSKQSSLVENIQQICAQVIFLESLSYLFLHLFIEKNLIQAKDSNNNKSYNQNAEQN